MSEVDITPYITMTKMGTNETIKIDERYVKIREGKEKIMAVSYKAPIFETIELERFFENVNSSQKIDLDIGGTGSIGVNFRGLIEGKEKNYSQNIDHKIILLEEHKCPKPSDLKNIKRSSSRFVSKVNNKK